MAEAEGIAGLDTSVAHPARVYDYWLGGTDNFAADRPRTVPWRASPSARKPGGYLVSACAARSMIALRSSRAPAR
jgi:hypothetical protein